MWLILRVRDEFLVRFVISIVVILVEDERRIVVEDPRRDWFPVVVVLSIDEFSKERERDVQKLQKNLRTVS